MYLGFEFGDKAGFDTFMCRDALFIFTPSVHAPFNEPSILSPLEKVRVPLPLKTPADLNSPS